MCVFTTIAVVRVRVCICTLVSRVIVLCLTATGHHYAIPAILQS